MDKYFDEDFWSYSITEEDLGVTMSDFTNIIAKAFFRKMGFSLSIGVSENEFETTYPNSPIELSYTLSDIRFEEYLDSYLEDLDISEEKMNMLYEKIYDVIDYEVTIPFLEMVDMMELHNKFMEETSCMDEEEAEDYLSIVTMNEIKDRVEAFTKTEEFKEFINNAYYNLFYSIWSTKNAFYAKQLIKEAECKIKSLKDYKPGKISKDTWFIANPIYLSPGRKDVVYGSMILTNLQL